MVELRKTRPGENVDGIPSASAKVVSPDNSKMTPSTSEIAARPLPAFGNPEKPFAVIRDGKVLREFKTSTGVLGDLQVGDTLEISGRGPYFMPNVPFNHLDVTVRAAAGSRPELVFDGEASHSASIKLSGLDLIFRNERFVNYTAKARWEISGCRIMGMTLQPQAGSVLKVTDSLLLLNRITLFGEGITAEFHNNIISASEGFHFGDIVDGQEAGHLKLTNNSIFVITTMKGPARLIHFGNSQSLPAKSLQIEARNNLFALEGAPHHGQEIFYGETPAANAIAIDWQGSGNLYCPFPAWGVTKDADGNDVVEHPLDSWARKLNRTEREPGSLVAPWPHWELAAARSSDDAIDFDRLKQQMDATIPAEARHEIGPQWDLMGPGDGYVRAMAAAGRPVAEVDLLPEALAGGTCVVLRNGMEQEGFATLQDAIAVSLDNDVIELRTNRNVGGGYGEGNRLLTIRAGAGYSPEVDTIHVTLGCRLIAEGLRFAPRAELSGNGSATDVPGGQFVRIANCSFHNNAHGDFGAVAIHWGTGTAELPLTFQNCLIDGTVLLNGHPDQPIRFENCILPRISIASDSVNQQRMEFLRCALWSAEPKWGRTDLISGHTGSPMQFEIEANGTLFETLGVICSSEYPLGLQGTKNLFRVGGPYWFTGPGQPGIQRFVSSPADLKTAPSSVTESFEAHPLAWSPSPWQLLPGSPGFQAGPDGKDIGADIKTIADGF